jgi:hypothetical protein
MEPHMSADRMSVACPSVQDYINQVIIFPDNEYSILDYNL